MWSVSGYPSQAPNSTLVGEQYIAASADALLYSSQCNGVDSLSAAKVDRAVLPYVRSADVRSAISNQLLPTGPILTMVAILNQENVSSLKLVDRQFLPVRRHSRLAPAHA